MKTLKRLLSAKWLHHLLFWLVSVYAIGEYFSISSILKLIDFIYSLIFHLPLLFVVYVNLGWLIPKLFKEGKYALYLLAAALTLFLAILIHEFTFDIVFPAMGTDFYMVSFADWSILLTIFGTYLMLSTLMELSRLWYRLQGQKKEQLRIELQSLRAQVNPHFLFNSLNSLYSLAREESEKTADAILELSDLLRYMLYEAGDEQVILSRELKIIEDYIELQKLRVDASTRIRFLVTGEPEKKKIAPLLIFPLIENAFKHGVKGVSDLAYVEVEIHAGETIRLRIKNNKGITDELEDIKEGGIGLENIQRRLALLYAGKHTFQIDDTVDYFEINMEIWPYHA
jgi:sensor histidine kinase YesM